MQRQAHVCSVPGELQKWAATDNLALQPYVSQGLHLFMAAAARQDCHLPAVQGRCVLVKDVHYDYETAAVQCAGH